MTTPHKIATVALRIAASPVFGRNRLELPIAIGSAHSHLEIRGSQNRCASRIPWPTFKLSQNNIEHRAGRSAKDRVGVTLVPFILRRVCYTPAGSGPSLPILHPRSQTRPSDWCRTDDDGAPRLIIPPVDDDIDASHILVTLALGEPAIPPPQPNFEYIFFHIPSTSLREWAIMSESTPSFTHLTRFRLSEIADRPPDALHMAQTIGTWRLITSAFQKV